MYDSKTAHTALYHRTTSAHVTFMCLYAPVYDVFCLYDDVICLYAHNGKGSVIVLVARLSQ